MNEQQQLQQRKTATNRSIKFKEYKTTTELPKGTSTTIINNR
jgi:hypothetical protein